MKLVDFRDVCRNSPPKDVLERAWLGLDKARLAGVREVRLYDDDPRANSKTPKAYGRYVPHGNTRQADVELYFWRIAELPSRLQSNEMYLVFILSRTFAHELYHHAIIGQRIKRQPRKSVEEDRCRKFGQRVASEIVHSVYPEEKFRRLWKEMREDLSQGD
jgi:hypothetical protein